MRIFRPCDTRVYEIMVITEISWDDLEKNFVYEYTYEKTGARGWCNARSLEDSARPLLNGLKRFMAML